jgi:hypothetical protein
MSSPVGECKWEVGSEKSHTDRKSRSFKLEGQWMTVKGLPAQA